MRVNSNRREFLGKAGRIAAALTGSAVGLKPAALSAAAGCPRQCGCPTHRAFCDVWVSSQPDCIRITVTLSPDDYSERVTKRLQRYYGTHDLHFITSSCYRRQPELGSAWRRDLCVKILEQARRQYRFVVHGYVVMPEHFHLLIAEPEVGDPSVVMKVIKERFSRRVNRRRRQAAAEQGVLWERVREPVWQKRFYDFNVWSARKHVEKLRYMHRNPVKRGWVERPEQWKWSSFRAYVYGETGPVRVKFQEWAPEIKCRAVESFAGAESPVIRKVRE